MQRAKLALVCLSWLGLASAASAQTAADPTYSPGVASIAGPTNFSGGGMLDGTYFDVRHVVGDGVGYVNSYSQIGAFTPFWLTDNSFVAPNSRLIITNSSQTGVNVGGVARTYAPGLDRIFGVYGYYDNDQDSREFRYNQVTVGAETMGTWLDVRGNLYMQVGNSTNTIKSLGLIQGAPYYVGNNIDFTGQQLRDQAMGGADLEAGTAVSEYAQWMRVYAGAYGYHTGTNSNTIGFRGRMEATVSNDLTLGVSVTQDSIYGTNINGTIDFKFSGFQPTQYFPNLTTRQRMLNPTQRNWRIATRTYVQNVDVAAINPDTGKPYFITHVDNSAPAGGDGTIERPLNNLQTSPPADIILVHMGNAMTPATAVTGFAQLTDHQRLLGDGLPSAVQLYAQYGNTTISNVFQLPQTNSSGNLPFVTSPIGDIVSLANYNEVANLNFVNAAGNAISNTPAGSHNFNLHDLNITGNGGMGINLTNASGIGTIVNINQGATNFANPMGLGNNAAGGIAVSTGGPGLALQLTNVNMNSNPSGVQPFGIFLNGANGPLTTNFQNVQASGNGTGILITESSQPVIANMNQVQANGNLGTGIGVSGVGGSIDLNIYNSNASGNAGDNLAVGSEASPIITSFVNVVVENSTFNNSMTGSGIVFSQSGGVGNYTLPGDAINNVSSILNAVDGLGMFASNGNQMNVFVHSAQLAFNGRDAIHTVGINGSTTNLYVDPTIATNSGRDAFHYDLNTDAVLNAQFFDNSFDFSGRSGMYGTLQNFSVANIISDYTTFGNSGADGFYLNASGQSVANIDILHGTFAASGQYVNGASAMNVISNNSQITLLTNFVPGSNRDPVTNVPANQHYGLSLNLANNSVFSGTIQNGDFSDNIVNGVNANVNSGSLATLTLFNTAANNSGADGVVINVDNAKLATVSQNSDVNNSVGDGVHATVTNGGMWLSKLDNSNLNANGGNGIQVNVAGGTSLASIIDQNGGSINNNGVNGLLFNVDAGSLFFNPVSTSVSNNGTTGIGSGIIGSVTNAGIAGLQLDNATVNNNMDNGIYVQTFTGGNIQATVNLGSVSNNGLAGITARHNDGIRLEMDNATNSFLQIVNGAAVNGNGDNGVTILANNATQFQGAFDSGFAMDNGQVFGAPTAAGFNVISGTGSNVNLAFNGFTIGNSNFGGTQQFGFLSNSNNSALLTAAFTSTTLNNNSNNAINTMVETSSATMIDLVNTVGNNSVSSGAVFDVFTGGTLFVSSSINSGFSDNGGSGLVVQVDGIGSVANLGYINPITLECQSLDMLHLDNNGGIFGGVGYFASVNNGGALNSIVEDASTISGNRNQGMQLIANVNSNINMVIQETDVTSNGSEGLVVNAQNGSTVNLRSFNTNYSGNGTSGVFDGVNILAIGDGNVGSAIVRSLFQGGTINSNTGNGVRLEALNGATMTTMFTDADVSDNGGYGILASANGATTQFNLLMSGTNTFNNNALGPIGPLSFSNMDQVALVFSGSFNNSPGDGVNVNLQNINNALVAFQGPGTVNNSAANGINIGLTNVTNGSVLIDKITEINDSGADGIKVTYNNVTNGALAIQGPTDINNSGQDGVDIQITNSNLIAGLNFGGANVTIVDAFDPANPCNLTLSNATFNALGYVPPNALNIDGLNIDGSGATGLSINLLNSTVQANSSFLTYNVVRNSGGDGILLTANNSTADGMMIVGSSGLNNGGSGLNIVGTNSSLADMVVARGVVSVNVGLDFTIVGNTFPNTPPTGQFDLINSSLTPGENILNFTLDTSTSVSGAIFNTETGANFPFTPFGGTDTATGLTTVNGTAVPPYPDNLVADFSQFLNLDFNNFTPGAHFQWDNDFDLTPGGDEGVNGSDLIGSTITLTFTGGYTLDGSLVALPGDPTSSHFVATGGSLGGGQFSDNANDGIRFSLDNTNMSNLTIQNTTANQNGTSGSGNGINFTGAGGVVNNSNLAGMNIIGNSLTLNRNDGFRLVNPTTTNAVMDMRFQGNTVTQNLGTGVNINLTSGAQDLQFTGTNGFTGNNINQNAGGPGLNIQLANNHNLTGDFVGNQFNLNGAQGVNLGLGTNAVVTTNFISNQANGNASQGVNIVMGTGDTLSGGGLTASQFYNNTISNNLGIGVNLVAPDASTFNIDFGDNAQGSNVLDGNTSAGLAVALTGSANGILNITNSQFSNTLAGTNLLYGGEGLNVDLKGTSVLNGGITNSSFNNNAGDGALFNVTGTTSVLFASLTNYDVDSSTFSNNGGNGLEFVRTAFGHLTGVKMEDSVFNGNTLNGISITAANKLVVDTYEINNNDISNNQQNGLFIMEKFDAQIHLDMNLNSPTSVNRITGNTLAGIQVSEQVNDYVADNRTLVGTWRQNFIDDNGGNGIAIDGATGGLFNALTNTYDKTVTPVNFDTFLTVGDASNNQQFGNIITNNGQNGVEVGNRGAVIIGSNLIQFNGTLSNLGTAAENAGIMLDVKPGISVDVPQPVVYTNDSSVVVAYNTISNNFGDGIQYGISQQITNFPNFQTGFMSYVDINSNDILTNSGRGIDLLNGGDNITQADISGNTIAGNQLEGIYIVNTASNTQDQNSYNAAQLKALEIGGGVPLGLSTVDGGQGGRSIARVPVLQLRMTNNIILGNGFNSATSGTGLVIQVGSADGLYGYTNPGGFASNGNQIATNGSPWTTIGQLGANASGFAGVTAVVDNNTFGGNAGNDILFGSFTSTQQPAATTGTWSTTDFDVTGFDGDPLSRFDLYFRNNVTDPTSIDTVGASQVIFSTNTNGYSTSNPAFIAFYNNTDSFKNNQIANPATVASGPFGATDGRDRNATRQAARIPFYDAPIGGPAGSQFFLYAGMGASTWRIYNGALDPSTYFDANTNTTTSFTNFLNSQGLLDALPIPTNTSQENGVYVINPGFNGQQPWGWGQF